jgi:hypothetical protein
MIVRFFNAMRQRDGESCVAPSGETPACFWEIATLVGAYRDRNRTRILELSLSLVEWRQCRRWFSWSLSDKGSRPPAPRFFSLLSSVYALLPARVIYQLQRIQTLRPGRKGFLTIWGLCPSFMVCLTSGCNSPFWWRVYVYLWWRYLWYLGRYWCSCVTPCNSYTTPGIKSLRHQF